MKFKTLTIISLIAVSFLFSCTQNNLNKSIDPVQFKSVPQSTKVHTWWHWMDGNISKEGITKDLESMSKQGIAEATILNIGLFNDKDFGISKTDFNTPDWYDMFKWALKEADRLNIKIGVHNCDGWSSSGGPWIKPKNAMKQITWNKQYITGGKHIELKLNAPFSVNGFYKDVAVLAYKSNVGANSFVTSAPEIILNDTAKIDFLYDANPISAIGLKKGFNIKINFKKEFKADKIAIHPRKPFMWGNMNEVFSNFSLWYADETKQYKKITNVKIYGLNKTVIIDIPTTTASSFKLQLDDLNNINSWLPYFIGEIELLQKDEQPSYSTDINNHQVKIASVKGFEAEDYSFSPVNNEKPGILTENIIDISSKISNNDELTWDAPQGNWTIIRFGYTITGAKNGPASKNGEGLECDKMDTTAPLDCRILFNSNFVEINKPEITGVNYHRTLINDQ